MKTRKTMLAAAAGLSLLALTACSSPTGGDAPPAPTPARVVLDFEGALDAVHWVNQTGWQNQAVLPAPSLAALTDQGYRQLTFVNNANGATQWNPTGFKGSQALKFTVQSLFKDESAGTNSDTHALMNFTNLDLGDLGKHTGLRFSVLLPKDADHLNNVGFAALIRQRTAGDENAAVYGANLSQGETVSGVLANKIGTDSDWTYFGDGAVFTFDIPFDYFRVPGWWSKDKEPAKAESIAAALAAGVKFNSIDFDFRLNKPGSSYTEDHAYTAYIDNITLY